MAVIDRLWPNPSEALSDDELLAMHEPADDAPFLRMNFISSIDGAVTRQGRSGGLGDAADLRVFELLRRAAHAVIVGAETLRVEEYGALRLGEADTGWRIARGFAAHPVLVIRSQHLDLDPQSSMFADAPVRPIIATVPGPRSPEVELRRAALAHVADIIETSDFAGLRTALAERGLTRLHCEGGPRVFGDAIAAGVVDELCLTVAPTLESGAAGRIAEGAVAAQLAMKLVSVLRAGDELFLRYQR